MSKNKKIAKKAMKETFIMVMFSFIFGTIVSFLFLTFLVYVITSDVDEVELTNVEENKTSYEKEHYDSSHVTEEDYELIENAGILELAIIEYCANVSEDEETENCPDNLDQLFPEYLSSEEEIGGELEIFTYESFEDSFELCVSLSSGAKDIMQSDGGNNDNYYELGNDLELIE